MSPRLSAILWTVNPSSGIITWRIDGGELAWSLLEADATVLMGPAMVRFGDARNAGRAATRRVWHAGGRETDVIDGAGDAGGKGMPLTAEQIHRP